MGLRVVRHLVHLGKSQRWDAQRVQASQLALLREVVERARRDAPMYRESYRRGGLTGPLRDLDEFRRLPVVTKNDLKSHFPDGMIADGVRTGSLYQVATSGTTDRVMSFQDEEKRDWDRAADLLMALAGDGFRPGHRRAIIPADACYERCGADEHGRTDTFVNRLKGFIGAPRGERRQAGRQLLSVMVRNYFWRLTILKALGVEGTAVEKQVLDEHVRELERLRPQMLSGLPLYLFILAKHVGEHRGRPLASIIRPAGGKMTQHMIDVIERSLGGRVRENYGTAELGTISFDCAQSRRQHLLGELFFVEFVRGDRAVGPGELGEILITDLRNRVAPLIRYAVGDVGRYFEGACGCGRTGLRFTVDGLVDETIVTPQGTAFSGEQIVDFFLKREQIDYAKVIQQDTDRFVVEVVPRLGTGELPSHEEASEDFGAFLGYPVRVWLRPVRRLAPVRSGKYKLVVSTSYPQFHEISHRGPRRAMVGADRLEQSLVSTGSAV